MANNLPVFSRRRRRELVAKQVEDQAFQKAIQATATTLLKAGASMPMSSWYNAGGVGAGSALLARVTQDLAASFGRTPDDVELALAEQGLSWGPPFPPGRPLDPFWGYKRPARTWDYTIGENVQVTPRWDRISFPTLKAIIEAYDVAQICLAPGTLVVAKRGLVPIEAIQVGDEVLTHKGRWQRVYRTMANPIGEREAYRVTAGALDPIVATGDHPVLAARYTHTQSRRRVMQELDWVNVSELKPRGVENNANWHYDAAVLPALDLDPEQHPEMPWDVQLGRLLGWYLAEGSQSGGRMVCFSLGPSERHYAEQILEDAKAVFGANGIIGAPSAGAGFRVRVYSARMARLFSCGTARTKHLPEWAWDSSRAFFRAMLDAWATGDGCLVERHDWSPRTLVVTASQTLAWQMRLVAITLGYKPSINRKPGGNVAVIRGNKVCSGPSYHVEWAEKPQRTGRWSFEADGRLLATAVKTVERVPYEGPVYNIEVEEDHSYVTTGGTVHNCVRHLINDVRSLDFQFVPPINVAEDATEDIEQAERFFMSPDKQQPFRAWLAEWLQDVLRYDAGCLFVRQNEAGDPIALEVTDGSTIIPFVDFYGRVARDEEDAHAEPGGIWPGTTVPAYGQIIQGMPYNWFTADQIIYQPWNPLPESQYGLAPMEAVLLSANTDIRWQWTFLQYFCYDDATEVLTDEGWKAFPDVRGDEQFATRSSGGEFQWQHTKDDEVHRFDYDGELVRFSNQCVDALVTPNHRMLVRRVPAEPTSPHTRWHDWHVRRADYFLEHPTAEFKVPVTSSWVGTEPDAEMVLTATSAKVPATVVRMPMWAWAKFLGVYIAEGWTRSVQAGKHARWEVIVSQLPGGSLDEVRSILKDTGLNWNYNERTGKFTVGCKALWLALQECGHGAQNKRLPDYVLDWTPEYLQSLLDGLLLGDGHTAGSGQVIYSTTSPTLAGQVQELWQKLGCYAWVRASVQGRGSHSEGNRIFTVRSRPETEFRVPRPTLEPYTGRVHCVSVPNGIIFVRRNGKALWCGNTDGTIPQGFMESPPDLSDPAQVQEWQSTWDALMMGDQAKLRQIRWVPAGAKYTQIKDTTFDKDFPLYLMRRVAASFGVTPNDLGFTDDINRATGDTQIDVQFRVGTLPLVRHVEDVLNLFIRERLKLKARIQFDTGREVEDRLASAQAEQIYWEIGALSSDEIRMKLGKRISRERPTPRIFNNDRSGPIPILAVDSLAGKIDPTTYGPAKGQKPITDPYVGAPGALAVSGSPDAKAATSAAAALQAKMRGTPQPALPAAPDPTTDAAKALEEAFGVIDVLLDQLAAKSEREEEFDHNDWDAEFFPDNTGGPGVHPEGEEEDAEKDATAGVSAETGIQGNPLAGTEEDDDEAVAKAVRRWRDNSRNRVRQNLPPKRFVDPRLPEQVADAIWRHLEKAHTRSQVDAVFGNWLGQDPADAVQKRALELLRPDIDRLMESAQRVDAAREALAGVE